MVFGFFFFKQKTAYEMRISDWSSDVCSSDLVGDIDMEDVVLNRRILITLIPALEKSADEVSSLGKINVAGLKDMMGKSIGNALTGDREEILLNKPTNADNAYGLVWDEAGYYTEIGRAHV